MNYVTPTRRSDAIAALATAQWRCTLNLLAIEQVDAAIAAVRAACKAHGVPSAGQVVEITCPDAACGSGRNTKQATYARVRLTTRAFALESVWRGIARAPAQNWRIATGGGYSARDTDKVLAAQRRAAKQ